MSDVKFSEWLESELTKRKISQAELARRAGVSRAAINHVLLENRQPGPDLCQGIARAFGIPLETIYRRADLLPEVSQRDEMEATILHLTGQMDDFEVDEIRAIIEAMVASRKKNQPVQERNF